jgi:hypothetical protein
MPTKWKNLTLKSLSASVEGRQSELWKRAMWKDVVLKISPHVTKSTGGYSDVLILEHRFRRLSSEKKVIDNS